MKTLGKMTLAAMVVSGWANVANAEITELPAYAYDEIGRIGLATTAADACNNIRQKKPALQRALQSVLLKLNGEGYPPLDVSEHLKSGYALAQIDLRGVAFREQYGIGSDNDAAFCQAIAAEAKKDRSFKKLMSISR